MERWSDPSGLAESSACLSSGILKIPDETQFPAFCKPNLHDRNFITPLLRHARIFITFVPTKWLLPRLDKIIRPRLLLALAGY